MSSRVKKRGLILLAILGTVFLPVLGMAAQQTLDRAAVDRGRVVYQKYGCFVCHGLGGAGGVRNRNSSSDEQIIRLTKVAENFTAEELNAKVLKGVATVRKKDPRGPTPPLMMPAYQGLISDDELNDLTAYQLSLINTPPEAPSAARPPVPAFMQGAGNCRVCHAAYVKQFENNIHYMRRDANLIQSEGGSTHKNARFASLSAGEESHADVALVCATCHGNADRHVQNPSDPAGNIRFTTVKSVSADEKNDACLACHEKGLRFSWQGSIHDSKELTCATCHSIHRPASEQNFLVKQDTMETCFQCHKLQRAQLQRTSHMPIREGKLTCTDCHNPHGTTTEKQLAANSVNENCYKCHAEKRGPFLWEHAPVAENCMNCHTPHGSNHVSLLRMERPRLCQRCHIESRHPTTPQRAATRFVFDRSCVNCHSQIHGSNHPSGVRFLR